MTNRLPPSAHTGGGAADGAADGREGVYQPTRPDDPAYMAAYDREFAPRAEARQALNERLTAEAKQASFDAGRTDGLADRRDADRNKNDHLYALGWEAGDAERNGDEEARFAAERAARWHIETPAEMERLETERLERLENARQLTGKVADRTENIDGEWVTQKVDAPANFIQVPAPSDDRRRIHPADWGVERPDEPGV